VIVIFASRHDPDASSLVARWAIHNASLLTCEDLSVAGWRHYLGSSEEASTAIVGGRTISVGEIRGVLVRWPGVFEQELLHIDEADRGYVAGEMRAFLVAWLLALQCPVINRPTPVNLSGPHWRLEQWTHAASRLGIPVQPARRHIALGRAVTMDDPPARRATVTVVGERTFGATDAELHRQARSLAGAAGVSLLGVSFSGPEAGSLFAGANLIPAISSDETADAVLSLLLGERGAQRSPHRDANEA
jgi:hypothetical protein